MANPSTPHGVAAAGGPQRLSALVLILVVVVLFSPKGLISLLPGGARSYRSE